MKKYELHLVNDLKEFTLLTNNPALSFEGLNVTNELLEFMVGWLSYYQAINEDEVVQFHLIKGNLINEFTASDDIKRKINRDIISITNIDFDKIKKNRFQIGGMWLKDIISKYENFGKGEMNIRYTF